VAALLAVRADPGSDRALHQVTELTKALLAANPQDVRPRILAARHYLARGQRTRAAELAKSTATLTAPHRRLLADVLAELGVLPEWRAAG
jgi:hypothetical protein